MNSAQQQLGFDEPEPAPEHRSASVGGERVVRVLPDEPAIGREFDYSVPTSMDEQVRIGTVVRVPLHGRRMGGWVVADHVEPPVGVELQPLARVSGWGPPPEVLDLADWAAWRWCGRPASILRTATPATAVRGL
ncbi:MAG: primosomal protein N', partial [Actinobacteria bacterium]|nr:primosomal protein N' [Actinomycetota bacterium]